MLAPIETVHTEVAAKPVFDSAHERMHGHGPMRLSSIAYVASAPVPHFQWQQHPLTSFNVETARRGERKIWFGDEEGHVMTPVYDRTRMGNGHHVTGPAIVESNQTTILIPSGWRLKIDQYDNAVLERN